MSSYRNPLYWLSPRQLLQQLQDIDTRADADRRQFSAQALQKRAWIVIMIACVCLLLVNYLKYSSALRETVTLLENLAGVNQGSWQQWLRTSQYRELWNYLWWGWWNFAAFILIPVLTIRFILRERVSSYGWQWGEVHKHWLGYVLLATPIIGFAIAASFRPDFVNHYPFYKVASRSWLDFLLWELIYVSQFIAVEFFFRGFVVNGLRPVFGSLSVAVMCLPYLMLHFPKPWLESTGAILFGFFLGILALKSRSIWGGVFVHVTIALTMDMAAMLQKNGLPQQWTP